jgi:hypothetical protein
MNKREAAEAANVRACRLAISRMSATYQQGLLTLQRKRTGGNQQVTVKHIHQQVNVTQGGQAVVAARQGNEQGQGTARRAWLRIFVVRCSLPCDPPVGGHSRNGDMLPRFHGPVCDLRPIGESSEFFECKLGHSAMSAQCPHCPKADVDPRIVIRKSASSGPTAPQQTASFSGQ